MFKLFLSSAYVVLCVMQPAYALTRYVYERQEVPHPFGVLDTDAEGIQRSRLKFSMEKAFPEAQFDDQEKARGFELSL